MKSLCLNAGSINLPIIDGEFSMIPFNMSTLEGLPNEFKLVAKQMMSSIKTSSVIAYFTIHGKKLKKSQTLRRGAPHTDGNYEPINMSFGGGGGFKVGENGPRLGSDIHNRQYLSDLGGIILASNFSSCLGWVGEFEGLPKRGGDCRHIELGKPFMLEANKIYYGNNHFIHESLPMSEDVHRVFARITLPESHAYQS
jgi:hypothetical protein